MSRKSINKKLIEVCDHCLTASCWRGEFMCQDSRNAGTVLKTNDDNYSHDKLKAIYGHETSTAHIRTGINN